jgi:hypothetical protein
MMSAMYAVEEYCCIKKMPMGKNIIAVRFRTTVKN